MHIAVDLGAGSGRVFLVAFDPDHLFLEEIHRFVYPPREVNGHLRWDFGLIFDQITKGLGLAAAHARELDRQISSVGVDSWGVDYGWIGQGGQLIADPVAYRDGRTEGVPERVFQRVPRQQIFEKTGIQTQRFNTIFQLVADESGIKSAGTKFLLLPDLINYHLTGKAVAEYTNATTTQMLNVHTGEWDDELLDVAGIRREAAPVIVPAGTDYGKLKPDLARELCFDDVKVIAPATHDTGSAVAAAPIDDNTACISSGTWSLVGIESKEPYLSSRAAIENFTNEGGVYGTFRFLKNVMGLWILERCRQEWEADGLNVGYDALLKAMPEHHPSESLIFPDDPAFLNPSCMPAAIEKQLEETGQRVPKEPTMFCKMILDSLALRYASVLRSIEEIIGRTLSGIEIVGGGGKNRYLNQMTANTCCLEVHAGLTEATVIGNAMVQAITVGRFSSLTQGREFIRAKCDRDRFRPVAIQDLTAARERYAALESLFTSRPASII